MIGSELHKCMAQMEVCGEDGRGDGKGESGQLVPGVFYEMN